MEATESEITTLINPELEFCHGHRYGITTLCVIMKKRYFYFLVFNKQKNLATGFRLLVSIFIL